jgi:hypothetical protein
MGEIKMDFFKLYTILLTIVGMAVLFALGYVLVSIGSLFF